LSALVISIQYPNPLKQSFLLGASFLSKPLSLCVYIYMLPFASFPLLIFQQTNYTLKIIFFPIGYVKVFIFDPSPPCLWLFFVIWACFVLGFWCGSCVICFIELGFLFGCLGDCRREMAPTSVKSFKQENSFGETYFFLFC